MSLVENVAALNFATNDVANSREQTKIEEEKT